MRDHLIIITGHYGSGKTEFAVNLALSFAREGREVSLADLDIVNPYFCSRGQRTALESQGVRVIASAGGDADLPAINPAVFSLLEDGVCGILDVGGDAAGARVLGRFAGKIQTIEHELLCVLNFNRPETATVEQALRYLDEIQQSAKLRATGLVGNTHLCGETSARDVLRGAELAREVAARAGIPVCFHAFPRGLAGIDALPPETRFPMDLLLKKPWEIEDKQKNQSAAEKPLSD